MKIKTFSLIEEYYPEKKTLADDQDVIYKINGVINSVMLDLMKYRKIPAKYPYTVKKNKPTLMLASIPEFYQLSKIPNCEYEVIGDYEILFDIDEEERKVDVYYFKYPELMELTFKETETESEEEISAKYDETFEFELSLDVLEIMPYGIAADLLKNDMISGYGRYFNERYQELKNSIDPRITSGSLSIVGGIDV